MRYKLLGRSGLRVSELCLGAMTFGEDWGWGASNDETRAIFDLFADAGGNFIDTANSYTNGSSEKLVGELIKPDRDKWVLATKYSFPDTMMGENAKLDTHNPNASGNSRKNMMRSVENSLKRLQTDHIDLLWLHAWDYLTPVDEIMRGLDDLVRAGKVSYVGVSDAPAWIISQANTLAELRGLSSFVALQIEYSLIERTPERDLIPMAQAFGLTVTPWSPLGGGVLTGKYNTGDPQADSRGSTMSHILTDRNKAIAQVVVDIAGEIGKSPSQVALAWLLHQGPNVIPIVGARKASQVKDNLACVDVQLSPDQRKKLSDASAIESGFPHSFLQSDMMRQFLFGGTYDAIQKPADRR